MLRWLWRRAADEFLVDFFAGEDAAREFEWLLDYSLV